VQIGSTTGTVESVGLRITTLRTDDGALRVIPTASSRILQLRRRRTRRAWTCRSRATSPIDRAIATLREVGEAWARESGVALDSPQVPGIMGFSGGDILLRLTVRVTPEQRLPVEAS
jgi:small conductance mechanosensitive channel